MKIINKMVKRGVLMEKIYLRGYSRIFVSRIFYYVLYGIGVFDRSFRL